MKFLCFNTLVDKIKRKIRILLRKMPVSNVPGLTAFFAARAPPQISIDWRQRRGSRKLFCFVISIFGWLTLNFFLLVPKAPLEKF